MSYLAGVVVIAVVGLFAGQLVDRMIVRLPVGRSLFWPLQGHCETCFAALSLRWHIPLLGYFACGGVCGKCGGRLRGRSLLVQLLTASLFVGLFVLYYRERGFHFYRYPLGYDESKLRALLIYHAILASLLVAATFIDLDWMIIPDSITVPGMLLGVGLGTFWYVELHPVPLFEPGYRADYGLVDSSWMAGWLGVEKLPPWAEAARQAVNQHWHDHWNRWLGFLTGIAGVAAGGAVVWVVRAVCSWILRTEAIGFGDVTLMAMIGAYLGWQTVLIAFFVAPVSAVFVSLAVWLLTGNRAIPYGPHLSVAAIVCIFAWQPIWRQFAVLFDYPGIFLFVAVAMLVILALVTTIIQGVKMVFRTVTRSAA